MAKANGKKRPARRRAPKPKGAAPSGLITFLKSFPDMAAREAFCERVGSTRIHLQLVGYGVRKISLELAALIERQSMGRVTMEELRPDLAPIIRYIEKERFAA